MTPEELYHHLIEEGCNPSSFRIEDRGGTSDVFWLRKAASGNWEVSYSERGIVEPPEFVTADEKEAVAYFRKLVLGWKHLHCVGLFDSHAEAEGLSKRLEKEGISTTRDSIPYHSVSERKYRVFVEGRSIFRAKDLLGTIPLK